MPESISGVDAYEQRQISQFKTVTDGLGDKAMQALRHFLLVTAAVCALWAVDVRAHEHDHSKHLKFDASTVRDGRWSDKLTWQDGRMPKANDRVLVSRGTTVEYDVVEKDVLRLVQVVGTLRFARDRDTELNAALVKVQDSDTCSEDGFACDLPGVNPAGEPQGEQPGKMPTLEIGTLESPIPSEHTARIRLHYLEGFDKEDAPALICCSARLELHGAPLSRTWVKLGATAQPGDASVTLDETVTGWRVGDELIVTGSKRGPRRGSYRDGNSVMGTEERRITGIDGKTIRLDKPLEREHYGTGEFRSEVANLSRNVIVESADPAGVRGHTMYHAYSQGGISYARFAHLGKERMLGRYAIHFHLVGDTMRGSQVLGVSIVDSHNRWVTIHGTEYLVVRDCVGYRSVGHGFFMEDGTEVYNLLDRNLGVQSYAAKSLPKQVLAFDQNDGAAFWWANGRNTIVRNVACENDQYGFRYDMQHSKYFNSTLGVRMPDGKTREVDVRTIPNWRFEDNESHTEGVAGMVVACNGSSQPDTSVNDQKMLDRINGIDWTGPDTQHPHIIRNFKIWEAHYAFRPQSPSMLIDGLRIDRVSYGVYRPAFDNQVYRNVHLTRAGGEPFNRGMDDASSQVGQVTVDGLTVDDFSGGGQGSPVFQMSDNNLTGRAESHFRNISWSKSYERRPLFNRGGQTRGIQFVDQGVPYYLHDYYGPGRHAKIVSTSAKNILADGNKYRQEPPLTGDESVVAEVANVDWPTLLDPVDDLAPATIITSLRKEQDKLIITGISHDNGTITSVTINGQAADCSPQIAGVVDWRAELSATTTNVIAIATDEAGNVEQTGHRRSVSVTLAKK
ncbi:MAG: hypothetical protein ACI9G1_003209 [Pirellulaceae bacterium]